MGIEKKHLLQIFTFCFFAAWNDAKQKKAAVLLRNNSKNVFIEINRIAEGDTGPAPASVVCGTVVKAEAVGLLPYLYAHFDCNIWPHFPHLLKLSKTGWWLLDKTKEMVVRELLSEDRTENLMCTLKTIYIAKQVQQSLYIYN